MQTQKILKKDSGKYNLVVILPDDYNTRTKYPLVVFLPGISAKGDNMDSLYNDIPPNLKKWGDLGFVIVAVQTPDTYNDEVIFAHDYAIQNYSIDESRKYLTGLSYGGGGTWNFASMSLEQAKLFHAIAPIATTWTTGSRAHIANANLPVWAFHNKYDDNGGTPSSASITFVNEVNKIKPGLATLTLFNFTHHGGWGEAYDPTAPPLALNGEGMTNPAVTLPEWFLMNNATTRVPVPGKKESSGLTALAKATVTGDIINLDGTESHNYKSAKWETLSAPAGVNKYAIDGGGWITAKVKTAIPGTYTYRLTVYPESANKGTPVSADVTVQFKATGEPIPDPFKPTHKITWKDGTTDEIKWESI